MDSLLKAVLPLYWLLFFSVVFVWHSYRVRKQTGINPVGAAQPDSAAAVSGRALRLAWALSAGVVVAHTVSDEVYAWTAPITWLENEWFAAAGLLLLTLSLAWTIAAQAQMGNSWRVGIDARHPGELVQRGLFLRSRNPIFLGMLGLLLGLFLAVPNAFSLLALGLSAALLQVQVRLEEEHLLKTNPAYRAYFERVPRWL